MIKIYTLPNCKYCTKAKEIMKEMNILYEEINLKDPKNKEAREYYRSLKIKSVPIIEGESFRITKFNEEEFKRYMESYAKEKNK